MGRKTKGAASAEVFRSNMKALLHAFDVTQKQAAARCKVDEAWFRRLCYSGIADGRALSVETLRRLNKVATAFNLDNYRKLWDRTFMPHLSLEKIKYDKEINECKDRFTWLWLHYADNQFIFEPILKEIDLALFKVRSRGGSPPFKLTLGSYSYPDPD